MTDAEKAAELVRRLEALSAESIDAPAVADDPAAVANAARQRAETVLGELVRLGSPSVEPLLVLLERDTGIATLHAANALSRLRDPRAVEPLLRKIKMCDRIPFGVYAVSLGQLGDTRAVAPLIEVLTHAEQRAAQDVVRMKEEYEGAVSTNLAGRIGRFLARRNSSRMDAQIESDSRALYCRFAASALGMLGDARAIDPLQRRRNDPDPRVREAVEKALQRLGSA